MDNKNKSPLIACNGLTHAAYGLWSSIAGRDINYSDGDAAENTLMEILRQAGDRTASSLELEAAIYDWVTEYHLSSDRANIYRFLDLSGVRTGLELGAGCGAVTRYLGEQAIMLDAVEGNRRRAEICRLRCNDLENVHVVHADFNGLKLPESSYDAVFLTGVLEYAGMFLPKTIGDRSALLEVLSRACSSLNGDGLLCIAIENRLGLKYWLGAREDHFGRQYVGLYGYPEEIGIRTYDRTEWESMLAALGGEYSHRFIYPFPDYKMARAILSEDFITGREHAYSHLYRMLSRDNGTPIQSEMNEFLLWEGLHKTGRLRDFANSFFILVGRNSDRLDKACPYDFMHFSGRGRKPGYRIRTSKRADRDVVQKEYLLPGKAGEPTAWLTHDLGDAPYRSGSLLITRWIHALVHSDPAVFEECIREFYRFLKKYWAENSRTDDAFDLLPFNIVVDGEGAWHRIDTEWHVHVPFTPEFILFRALLWFPFTSEMLLGPVLERNGLETVQDFIGYGFQLVSLDPVDRLAGFVALEESIQAEIEMQVHSQPVQKLLRENLRYRNVNVRPETFPVQLYWSGENGEWSEDRCIDRTARIGADSQTITFRLPPTAKNAARLRFDPVNQAGFIHISSLRAYAQPDGQLIWEINGSSAIAAAASMNNLHYCKSGLGEVFIATSNDPSLIFDPPEKVKEAMDRGPVTLQIEMDWPRSTDFLVAMDSLGKKLVRLELEREEERNRFIREFSRKYTEEIKEKSDQVRTKDIHIGNLEAELTAMKQTRIWRNAEWMRRRIYYPLLDARVLLKKSFHTLRHEGPGQVIRKARRVMSETPSAETVGQCQHDYDLWMEKHRLTGDDLARIRQDIAGLPVKSLVSIVVPVYDVDEVWLTRTIESVRSQLYENWELCLCDDCSPKPHIRQVLQRYAELDSRIKVLLSEKNSGIAAASNMALSLATGDFVGLLDHDDELTVDALYEVVRVINQQPEADLIYSDEDKLDMQGRRVDPFFKPDFSPELIYSQNYICHFTVIRKSILDEIGGFREEFDGSQDHDLILRTIEKARRVCHIPKILYHWRKIPGSTAAVYDSKSYAWEAGRKAIEESLARTGIKGKVYFGKYQGSYRVQREIIGRPPVSVIIPFRDKADLLRKCIGSILEKSTYPHFEILGVSNNSSELDTREAMAALTRRDKRVRFVEYNVPFNFAGLCNHGVEQAGGEYVVLLNNDIEIITPEWMEALLELAQADEIGAVGGKLIYPDQRIQHAGIVLGMAGVAGHPHHFFHKDDVGYYARPHVIHNVSAVTGACMMVGRDLYRDAGGMDSEHFAVAYNDVDFCLKLLRRGLRNVFTPYCEMIHYESATRGYEDTPDKLARLQKEAAFLAQKWPEYIGREDPWYNPNLSLESENFAVRL
ncbi:MAG: glycosyltransferase [Desulfobulbaceae bacterium]|nr:glycosyltransferase [Desulfobulbaceae bacterium]